MYLYVRVCIYIYMYTSVCGFVYFKFMFEHGLMFLFILSGGTESRHLREEEVGGRGGRLPP